MTTIQLAEEIYTLLNVVNDRNLTEAYDMGMIRKENLVVGKTYIGHCRNADEAIWSNNNCFVYQRHKFNSIYPENIVYPSDDEGYDIFVPVAEATV